jgi:hypothetical protein
VWYRPVMAETGTLSDLLAAQSERKLIKMRDGIVSEMERLRLELRLVEGAISKKRKPSEETPVRQAGPVRLSASPVPRSERNGRFEGLPSDELLAYVMEIGQPVRAPEVREYLLSKGIVRKLEAVRVALHRLEEKKKLVRDFEGRYIPVPAGQQELREGDATQVERAQ